MSRLFEKSRKVELKLFDFQGHYNEQFSLFLQKDWEIEVSQLVFRLSYIIGNKIR